MRDHPRGSQSYMKNRRGRKEIEVSRRRERRIQEERDRSIQLSFSQSVLHSPDTQKDSLNWIGKRRGKEEIELF